MTSMGLGEHLTDEQFADVLAGEAPGESAEDHLAACVLCRREIAAARGAMASFDRWSMTWARQMAPRVVHVPSRWTLGVANLRNSLGLGFGMGSRQSACSVGVAAMLIAGVMAVGLKVELGPQKRFHMLHRHTGASQATSGTPSRPDFAEDNELMQSIDEALRYDTAPVVSSTELRRKERRTGNRL